MYKRTNDGSISPTDLSTFEGKKVGGIRDNQITAFTLAWMKEKGVNLEVIYYDSFEEQEKACERAGSLFRIRQASLYTGKDNVVQFIRKALDSRQ